MSRNFELLRQAEKPEEMTPSPLGLSAPANGFKKGSNLDLTSSEEVKKVVQGIFQTANSTGAPRVVLFAGVEKGDGCSWMCARTGESLAARGAGSVCIIDANLRTPTLHDYFKVDNLSGLTDAVSQDEPIRSYTRQLTPSNLYLLPSGPASSDPHAVLSSERLRTRIAELRAEFDHVLIDVAPMNLYTDAIIVGSLSDGVVLVVGANSTRRESVVKARDSMISANGKVLGAVLNKRRYPIPEGLYRRL